MRSARSSKILPLIGLALGLLIAGAFIASFVVSRPLFDERLDPARLDRVAIASPEVALTLAIATVEGRPRPLLVTQYAGGKVTGVDLAAHGMHAADALKLLSDHTPDKLRSVASSSQTLTVDASALELPFASPEKNIGVGLNYREHARESTLDAEPFLFPKFARPTRWNSDVARAGSTLLDYEAEIGLVSRTMSERSGPVLLGLVLANEMTDRWPLLRGLDRSKPMGTTGFADGKSREGFAPIGPFLVIPRNLDEFIRQIELELYVNGRLRQREKGGAMLWPPPRILSEVFEHADESYAYRDGTVGLLHGPSGERIEPGTIIFSGTPAGVIFRPLNLVNPFVYLRPGDEVVVRADYLGVIRNRIVK